LARIAKKPCKRLVSQGGGGFSQMGPIQPPQAAAPRLASAAKVVSIQSGSGSMWSSVASAAWPHAQSPAQRLGAVVG
jgi:hypothetical protein